ncbi:MAG: MerR family transcriptional regulator [Deltaproteobacteria bacterium]|nr:MerR family transcriptional regulator [Deltaproteobacteria bacterium]
MKMAELVERTGVSKSTILYYVREGLLPPPVKTSKNMAYYSEDYIDRIRLIKELQEKRFFPLSRIKDFLEKMEAGADLDSLLELDALIFHRNEIKEKAYTEEEFLEKTGLGKEKLEEAERLELLLPLSVKGEKRYDEEDLKAGIRLSMALSVGIDLKDLVFYPKCGEKIIEEEMALRNKIIAGKEIGPGVEITSRLAKGAKELRTYILTRLFQRKVQEEIQEGRWGEKKIHKRR